MATDTQEGYETVTVDREGYVGRITLDRPEAMNTFSTDLATELDAALHDLDDADDVRAVVVDGAGDAFSAGIDLSEYDPDASEDAHETWVARMEEPFHTIHGMATPVVAAAHGHAAANGIGLVAACDLAVAAEGTMLGATAPKAGLFCMGPAVPLLECLPKKRATELLLTGELIDAETAAEWGLLNRVAPGGEHVEAAMELAETMAAKSPEALRRGKQAVSEFAGMPYGDALDRSNEAFAGLCATDDAREGIAAFLDGEPLAADEWPQG
ncbi:enoyl-CoA hydratase/isomerase family protein [Haloglomus litoreum]|uniref:enoyl-CoA hydratase/isomerase family protein n=1 Tax=Haloglomus litoreum TaxID=3034026 RepID=UPI0023E88D40|nr:enoyl-CoA hydratase-related protein [Haloglomus sp. DT116]